MPPLVATWDAAESRILALLARVILTASLIVASPFMALTFLFFLLEKPVSWMLTTGALAVVVLVLGLVGWLVVRAKLRKVRAFLADAERAARTAQAARRPPDDDEKRDGGVVIDID